MRWQWLMFAGAIMTAAAASLTYAPEVMTLDDGPIHGTIQTRRERLSPRGHEAAGWLSYVASDRRGLVVAHESSLDGLALRVGGREYPIDALVAGPITTVAEDGVILQSGVRVSSDAVRVSRAETVVARRFEKALVGRDFTNFTYSELLLPLGAWATVVCCRDGDRLLPCDDGGSVHVTENGVPAGPLVAALAMLVGVMLLTFAALRSSPLPLIGKPNRRGR